MSREEKAQQVRNALAKICRQDPRKDINKLRIIIALERTIARFETVQLLEKHIVFKGGFVLLKTIDTPRFTKDLDALATGLAKEKIIPLIKQALQTDLNDGMWYGDVEVADLVVGEYGGLRFTVAFQIGDPPLAGSGKLPRVNIDVGIGDQIPKNLPKNLMPQLVHHDTVSWVVYPLEYTFAEKLEALFRRGSANSRAKDIYDLGLLFSKCNSTINLRKAIKNTFNNRGTPLPQSFFDAAQQIDPQPTMQTAWKSVVLAGDKPNFTDVWQKMLNCLQQIDKIRESS